MAGESDAGVGDRLRRAYEDGRDAARAGEEAAPGCAATPQGRAFLQGYVDGAAERASAPDRQGDGPAR